MKKVLIVAVVTAVGLLASNNLQSAVTQGNGELNSQREMSLAALTSQFANPSKEFRSAPLWVWNTDVKKADVDRMLVFLKEQGFGGALVHPRPGMVTEYLSPEWFELWRYSLEKGKELGLDLMIYDENSYPSGFAGGHVPAQMPESYNQGSCLQQTRTTMAPKPGECYMCLLRKGDKFIDITAILSKYQGKKGDYYVYNRGYYEPSAWTAGYPYTDLLAKGVTEKFLEVTMTNGYEKYLGDELGKGIKGLFTDEPNIVSPSTEHCRWTPDLFDEFQKMWGYDLRPNWPLLSEEIGDWRKVRHDYNATLLRMFIDRWAKPMSEYLAAHGMVFTGHYWEHDWPDLMQGPDNMAMYAWHQLPAIDMLFNQYNDNDAPQAQFGNVRSVKELSSVANQMGRVRALCETYGGGGWDETMQDLKRLGDWEYALGVNFMNQHLCHMTVTGARKFDYPPEFTPLSPWWNDYGALNTYFGRLSVMLSQGEQRNDWLILEPTTSLWMHYTQTVGTENDDLWKIANAFQHFVTFLEKNHMEYDLGCENIIADHGSVTNSGGFTVGERTYSTVVLPPEMTNIESSTFKLLKDFVAKGGRLVAFPQLEYVDGAKSAELARLLRDANVIRPADETAVLAMWQSESPVKIAVKGDKHVYHMRRVYDDGELLFFVNSSNDSVAEVTFEIPGKKLAQWDAMTGEILAVTPTGVGAQGRLRHTITLHPAASALFAITDRELGNEKHVAQPVYGEPLQAVSELQIKPLRHNALTLDFCDLIVDGQKDEDIFYKEANTRLWAHFDRKDPWETAVQYKRNILETDTFTMGNVTVEFPLVIADDVDFKDFHVIVERPDVWQLWVNGRKVDNFAQDNLLDTRCGDFAIGSLLQKGENKVAIHLDKMHILAEVGPVILLGDFSVIPAEKGFEVGAPKSLALGDYARQGLQMYPWEVCYTKKYEIADDGAPHQVKLGDWKGTVAQVWINGRKAGTIAYPPYQLDITEALQPGENEVEVRVIGSNANLYGPHYAEPSGIMGPWMWNDVTTQRPGADYSLFPYGLFTDFIVY